MTSLAEKLQAASIKACMLELASHSLLIKNPEDRARYNTRLEVLLWITIDDYGVYETVGAALSGYYYERFKVMHSYVPDHIGEPESMVE